MYNLLCHLNILHINNSNVSCYSCCGHFVMMTVNVKMMVIPFKFSSGFMFIRYRICTKFSEFKQ